MPPIPGMMHWHHYLPRIAKSVKAAISKAARTLDNQLGPQAKLEPVLVRNTPKQPTHPLARIRQSQSRWYSTARRSVDSTARHFTSSASTRAGVKYDRASFPKSRTSASIAQSSGRAPFAHTLRPNITGGTLGRTAGGYTLGSGRVGGARYFSHGPACQAQVVQNVSQAVRAFFVGGQKAQFDGVSMRGEKRYKAVTALQEETGRKMRNLPKATPSSYVDFRINPTVTALTPLAAIAGFEQSNSVSNDHLNTDGLLDVLSADFSRTLKDLAAILNDLRRLSVLGDLPITYEGQYLRIHFPGVDAATVERLCEELNVTRGTVVQDEAFDTFVGTEIALLFPFAPSAEVSEQDDCASFYEPVCSKARPIDIHSLVSTSHSPAYSTQSAQSGSDLEEVMLEENPWLSSESGYQSVHSRSGSSVYGSDNNSPLEYQGFEGIYRFIEELDSVRRR
ncbi:Casein kinase II beta 2 subunit [Teratosphaeria destructans]|uniref:Casein kinase II beta 2 subunit n=1 Tax=Teratosphaeria destructans TaxID=418781 RepID=A0A9W7T106_9PEZI|nr:Casein kinase II beta 2 subunit [Teratosphaeria destructans]